MVKLDAPTEDEVLAALEKATVKDGRSWKPANRIDVAEAVARSRGWNGTQGYDRTPAGYNPTRASVIGQWVSVKAVTDILGSLNNQAKAYAFYGGHKFIAGSYGITASHVYYLSQEALNRAIEGQRQRWVEGVQFDARQAAEAQVLMERRDDVERYQQENLTALLAKEPDWQAMLNDDDEEGN